RWGWSWESWEGYAARYVWRNIFTRTALFEWSATAHSSLTSLSGALPCRRNERKQAVPGLRTQESTTQTTFGRCTGISRNALVITNDAGNHEKRFSCRSMTIYLFSSILWKRTGESASRWKPTSGLRWRHLRRPRANRAAGNIRNQVMPIEQNSS